ncbi:glycosyltransferase family 2 protein [bacterium]|nr:glycosyltransferase family 2 protein [bacterium]
MAKVSVVIPVYNVENYLKECLDSVVNQSMHDIEIICVDDGSTDNSAEILRQYAQNDSRIKLIFQQNSGVGAARNNAFEVVTGDYIMCLDSDDYLVENACEIAFNAINENNADIGIFSNFNLDNGNLVNIYEKWHNKKMEYAKKSGDYSDFQVYVWDKIYRTEFIKNNNLRIPEGLKTAEDVLFSWMCNFKDPKYCTIPKPLYVYRCGRNGSATSKVDSIKNDEIAFKKLYENPDFKNQPLELQLEIINRFCGGSVAYLNKFYGTAHFKQVLPDAYHFTNYLSKLYSEKDLKHLKNYSAIKNFRKRMFVKQIFSVRNSDDKKFKIFTILGIKLKIKRK